MANEERINKIIDELTLFDDDLMSRVFDKNIEATEYVLQIILIKAKREREKIRYWQME